MIFKLMDNVILKNGTKGVIFKLPEIVLDPSIKNNDIDNVYGVLYVDAKGFHYGPYDIKESDMTINQEVMK